MKKYRVKYSEGGQKKYAEFETMEQANELYGSLNGKAEIQKYNDEVSGYEIVTYPEFEF